MVQNLLWRPIWCHFCPRMGGSGSGASSFTFSLDLGSGIWDLGSRIGYRGPGPRALGPGGCREAADFWGGSGGAKPPRV